MTKKYFEDFKNRFGEVTMIGFYDPLKKINRCLNFKSNRINLVKVDWCEDAMLITYIETLSYIDWNGNKKCHKEKKVQYIKRENIHQVFF